MGLSEIISLLNNESVATFKKEKNYMSINTTVWGILENKIKKEFHKNFRVVLRAHSIKL